MSNVAPPTDSAQSPQTPAFVRVRDLPIELFGSHHGRQTRKFVLTQIASHAGKDGKRAWVSLETLAYEVGLQPRGARKVTAWLEGHKFLEVDHHSHWVGPRRTVNTYTVLTTGMHSPWPRNPKASTTGPKVSVNGFSPFSNGVFATGPEASTIGPEGFHDRSGSIDDRSCTGPLKTQREHSREDSLRTHGVSTQNPDPQKQELTSNREQTDGGQGPERQQPAGNPLKTQNPQLTETFDIVEQACVDASILDADIWDKSDPDDLNFEVGLGVAIAITKKLLRFPDVDPHSGAQVLIDSWFKHGCDANGEALHDPMNFFDPNAPDYGPVSEQPHDIPEMFLPQHQPPRTKEHMKQQETNTPTVELPEIPRKPPAPDLSASTSEPKQAPRKPPTFAEFARRVTDLWSTIQPKSFRALTQAEQGQLTVRWARTLREDATYKNHHGHVWPIGLDTAGNLRVVFTSQQIADEMWPTVGPQLVRIAHDWNPAIQQMFYMAPRQVA